MVGQTITLNDLIQTANKKAGAEAGVLLKLADKDGLEGQLEEIIHYVEDNEPLFSDKNLTDVKTALAKFMRKLPQQKLKLTLAAMKREMDEFKAQRQETKEDNGGGILNQADLDALLAEAQQSLPPRKPKLVKPAPKSEPKAEGGNGSASILDQSDIDGLFSKSGPAESDNSQSMDQSFIDSLFSQEASAAAMESDDQADPEPIDSALEADDDQAEFDQADDQADMMGAVDQDFVDSLLAQQKGNGTAHMAEEESGGLLFEEETEEPSFEVEEAIEETQSAAPEEAEEAPEPEAVVESRPEPAEPVRQAQYREEDRPLAAPARESVEDQTPPPEPLAQPPLPDARTSGVGSLVPASLSRVLEERGEATIIKEFYRVYVRENGSFRTIYESDNRELAQLELLKTVQDFPARQVSLGKIVHKEVLVIKEDTNDIPFSLKIDFSE